jgi:hypothetical protein
VSIVFEWLLFDAPPHQSAVVTNTTTVYELYGHLLSLGLVPANHQHLYFTHGSRRVNWTDTMQSLGLGPLSHLQMRIIVPGGANAGMFSIISSLVLN